MTARVTVVGTGYVGLVSGACLAAAGNQVVCHDIDAARIDALRAGRIPIHEPGLDEVVKEAVAAGKLSFESSLSDAMRDAQVVLLAVGTPPQDDGSADLRHLHQAADDVAVGADRDLVLVIRSTVPPGTGDALQRRLEAQGHRGIQVVNVPEFLAEGTAVRDFQDPDRLVFGGDPEASRQVAGLWDRIGPEAPRLFMDRPSAELTKYAANTFLAARVSLINEIANLADAIGADVRLVAQAVGADDRIGAKFLRAGIGYGGSCFPKDVQALAAVARQAGIPVPVVDAVEATNETQWQRTFKRAQTLLDGARGKKVAILGIAFKPGTDDTRSAPGLRLARALLDDGADIVMHDPVARLPAAMADSVQSLTDPLDVVSGADLLIHVTEWPMYAELPWADVATRMKTPQVIDARNTLPWPEMEAAGMEVEGIGARPETRP